MMSSVIAPPAEPWAWRRLGPAILLLVAVLLLFRATAADIVAIWIRSDTFTHAFLVPPIAAWLMWRRRDVLAGLPRQPVPWMLVPIALACFLWLLGELAEVAAASQFAFVSLLVLSVPALFGWAVTRALLFPLLFLFFAVPFGEFAVPQLQEWTADVTVLALRATGIPVYREGLQFVIPSGAWSVVEACSGVRYLIACFMVGTLFAYLNYRSTRRRVIFVLASLLVPIVANWIRAYTIVMIGHLTGSPMILGVEHTTYGWFLFGAVVMVFFWAGAHWAEDDRSAVAPLPKTPVVVNGSRGFAMTLAILALLIGAQVWAWHLDRRDAATELKLQLPDGGGGWAVDPAAEAPPWMPAFINPSGMAFRSYVQSDQAVGVWVGYYRHQGKDRKLVSSANRVEPDDRTWRQQAPHALLSATGLPTFRTETLRRGHAPSLGATDRMRVWHVYWLGGRWITSDSRAKLWQAWDRLRGNGDDGAVVLLITPLGEDADAALEKFSRANLAAIEAALTAARESR
jgi:exosortase A